MMNKAEAVTKLEEAIEYRQTDLGRLLERVYDEVPEDALVKSKALVFAANGHVSMGAAGPNLIEQSWSLHDHALRQVADRVGIPGSWAAEWADAPGPEEWKREALSKLFQRAYQEGDGRYLVRSVKGEARGFLSDRFRRLDTRPILEAAIERIQHHGGLGYEGRGTDIRVAVKAVHPEIREVMPGEWMAFGMEWHNSDYGSGAHEIRQFLLRLICTNGAVGESMLRNVHLGSKLDESLVFSDKTYKLDTKTTISAMRDAVDAVFSEDAIDKELARIEAAAANEVSWAKVQAKLAKSFSKDELRRIGEAYEGPDVLNLPKGQSMWRVSNAISWIGQQVESVDRRLEFERMAGAVLVVK